MEKFLGQEFITSENKIDIGEIWNNAKELIANDKKVTAISFDVWIKTLEPVEIKGNAMVLATPSLSSKKYLVKNYKTKIASCLNQANSSITDVEFVIGTSADELRDEPEEEEVEEENSEITSYSFNPKYTFDSFVVGPSNQFVAAAAKAVAENPGGKYNPLFIYGGVGLGKTHLLHAIGNYITEHKPALKVVYVTCDKFTNDLIASIRDSRKDATAQFRAKYRTADVLIIDDIEFIATRNSTQMEFFNTFNDLNEAGKQIVISSDRPPKDINPLEERLRSRFEWGLLADIGIPDIETKIAILSKKAQIEHYNVSRDVIEYIAGADTTNIRTLEGMLSRAVFYAGITNSSIVTLDIAREALKDIWVQEEAEIDAGRIIDSVCKFYNIKKDELLARKRTKEIAQCRQVTMYLISEMLSMPLEAVGNIFGKNHATVIYAKNKVAEDMAKNKKFATEINDIRQMVKGK
ncbi:MAG: chromosomal replication initiator protein DnaA [Clostridia bacterium]|nr:chromosomal replication initiator protein DnaA [Clostridia bacterium]